MAARFFTVGMIACLSAMAASSSVSTLFPNRTRVQAAPGTAQLRAFGGRSAQQRGSAAAGKFDGALADLSRHAGLANPSSVLADLHSMSPAAKFKLAADGATPLVAIDAITRGDSQQLKTALVALGLERAAVYANDVGGWLPVSQLAAAAARAEVQSLRAAMSRTRTGAVTSQGDFVQHSAALRASNSLTGAGITVGVLSDSYDCYAVYAEAGSGVPASGYAGYAYNGFTATAATDVSTGDLPAGVNVLEEADCLNYGAPLEPPFGDEGRAMLQIVHDVAPGASLAFYTAETSEADFANGIGALATAGATVIADDVGYFDEPFYQDGLVAQAIDAVEAPATGKAVAYFSAAGNDGDASYENTAPSFATLASSGSNSGEYLLNFDTTAATTTTSLPITLDAMQPGEFTAIVVEWDQPYVTGAPNSGGATSRIDVCVTGSTSVYTIQDYDGNTVTCTGPNAAGVDPVQILIIANPANASGNTPQETLNLVIGLAADGTAAPTAAPGRIKVAVETDGQTDPPITQFATNSATLQGHPGAAGAAAVGAAFYFQTPACGTTPAVIESYSSEGGAPILFSATGARLATPTVRQKPDFVGPDGGNDTFLGFTLASGDYTGANGELTTSIAACQNNPSYPNFFGTSAATPHVASIAALMLQANSALTPTQIYTSLQNSALPMGGTTGFNYTSGYGFVQAATAFASLPLIAPPAPTLSSAAASVVAGSSTTITWSSVNATSCTSSGSWSGTLATSGTQTVTPTTVGTATYTLTCANTAGSSAAASASLSVTAAAATTTSASPPATSTSSGGGGLGWGTLLGLAGLALARYRRAEPRALFAT
jgi:hypothetical protein